MNNRTYVIVFFTIFMSALLLPIFLNDWKQGVAIIIFYSIPYIIVKTIMFIEELLIKP